MRRHKSRRTTLAVVGMMMVFLSGPGPRARGQELDPDRWRLSVTPYFWASGVTGDVTVRGNRVDVDVGFNEILDAFDFGGLVHIEAQKGRWGLFVDTIYLALSTDKDLNVVNAKLELDQWIVEFAGFYRLLDQPGYQGWPMSVDVLLGGRYWNIDADLDIGPLGSNVSNDWVDPFVGLRWTGQFNKWLLAYVRGDVGGFGIYDDASKFTWNVEGGPIVKLSETFSIILAYKALNIDRDQNELETNLTFAGPALGLYIQF
jgi:hypothetical protein